MYVCMYIDIYVHTCVHIYMYVCISILAHSLSVALSLARFALALSLSRALSLSVALSPARPLSMHCRLKTFVCGASKKPCNLSEIHCRSGNPTGPTVCVCVCLCLSVCPPCRTRVHALTCCLSLRPPTLPPTHIPPLPLSPPPTPPSLPHCNGSALVMLDFGIRHGFISPDEPGYAEICHLLRAGLSVEDLRSRF